MKRLPAFAALLLTLTILFSACTPTAPDPGTTGTTPAPSTGNVIRVSTTGDDSGDGVSTPVRTVARALELAAEKISSEDVTIELLNGTHSITEALNITHQNTSREEGHILTLRGEDGAVISGGVSVSGWEEHADNIWKVSLPDLAVVNGFYADGEPMQIARMQVTGRWIDSTGKGGIQLNTRENFLNFADYNAGMKIIDCYFTTSGKYQISLDELKDELPNLKMYFDQTFTRTVFSFSEATETNGGFVLRSDETTLNMLNGAKMADYNLNANRYYLANSHLFLDEEGEYYFDKDNRQLYYYTAEDPNGKDCVVPVSEGLLNIQGTKSKLASNIRIENISFVYGTSPVLTQTNYKQLQSDSMAIGLTGEDHTYERMLLPAQITLDCASNVTIDGCTFTNFDSTAIGLREYVYNTSIINSDIRNMHGSGIAVGTFNLKSGFSINDNYPHPEDLTKVYSVKKNSVIPAQITISNNTVDNCGIDAISSNGILIYYAWNTIVSQNSVSNIRGGGICVGWGNANFSIKQMATKNSGNIRIEKNAVSSTCMQIDDAGAIYVLGAFFGDGCIVRDNFIDMKDAIADDLPSIYLDEGSEYVTVTNNVSVNTRMWLHCRALPLITIGGKVQAGDLEGNSIMNCTVTGNYSSISPKMLSYGSQAWPYATAVKGSNVTISDNTVDQQWRENPLITAIVDAAGAQR